MMLGPGARLVKNDGISVSAFYDALSTICLRKFRKVVPKLVFGTKP